MSLPKDTTNEMIAALIGLMLLLMAALYFGFPALVRGIGRWYTQGKFDAIRRQLLRQGKGTDHEQHLQ